MTFKVEDGTGQDDSNSYASVAESDSYFTDRGNSTWTALTSTVKEQNLIKATDYIDQVFGTRFLGSRVFEEQALQWPRQNTGNSALNYDDEEEEGPIPNKLKYACIEYAFRSYGAPLSPDPTFDASGVSMVTTKEKVGPIEVEKESAAGTSNSASVNLIRPYPGADMYLKELLIPGGSRTYR